MGLVFIESFRKLDKRFIYVVLCDLLFYFAFVLAFFLFARLFVWSFGSLYTLPGQLLALSKMGSMAQLESSGENIGLLLRQFRFKLVLSLFLTWFVSVVVFTLFKGPAWAFVSRQKIDKKFLLRFFKFNLYWFGALAVITLLLFKLTKPGATGFSMFLLMLLALYFTPVCCAVFNPKKGVRELLKRVWQVGVERFYYFILPVLAAFGILLLVLVLVSSVVLHVFPDIAVWFLLAVFVVWQSWFKYYFYFVAGRIK